MGIRSFVNAWPPALVDFVGTLPGLQSLAAHIHEERGRLARAAALVAGQKTSYAARLAELVQALEKKELPLPPPPCRQSRESFDGRVLLALHASAPERVNGYAVRTRCLLDHMAKSASFWRLTSLVDGQ